MAARNTAPVEVEPEEKNTDDEKLDLGNIKLVDKAGTWGIVYGSNRNYVTLLNRNYYEKETIGTKGRGSGKVYPAGSYGAWKFGEATYPKDDRQAILAVAKALYNQRMDNEARELEDGVQVMQEVWDELSAAFFAKMK